MSLLSSFIKRNKSAIKAVRQVAITATAQAYGVPPELSQMAGGLPIPRVPAPRIPMPQVPLPMPVPVPNYPSPVPKPIRTAIPRARGRFDPTGPWGDEGELPPGYKVGPRGNVIKRRRMNPTNPRALRRAVRRLSSYTKLNKRIEQSLRKLAPRTHSRRAPVRAARGGGTSIVNVD